MAETESPEPSPERGNVVTRGFFRLFSRLGKSPAMEHKDLERSAEEAQRLTKELEKYSGNRCLILTVGSVSSDLMKTHSSQFSDSAIGLVVGATQNGIEAVELYEGLRRISPNERVVLIIDDDLPKAGGVRTGLEIASKIDKTSQENGWATPKIIATETGKIKRNPRASLDSDMGHQLHDVLPQSYLGYFPVSNFKNLSPLVFEAIRTGITIETAMWRQFERDKEERKKAENNRMQQLFEPELEQMEKSKRSAFTETAKAVLAELEQQTGKRAFLLIIDDSPDKHKSIKERIAEYTARTSVGYVVGSASEGNDGIILYEEFARLAPQEKVVVIMDGNLKEGDKGGLVTERLIEATRRHNLPLPFIVGGSADTDKNEDIQAVNPEIYLGSYYGHETTGAYRDIFEVIDSKL